MSGPTLATLGIKVENGDVLKATTSLDGMTVAGAKTEAATQRLTRRMALLEIEARNVDASFGKMSRDMALAEIEARKMDAAMGKAQASTHAWATSLVAAGAALAAGFAFHEFIKNTVEAQNALAQLEAAVKSTAGVAGRSVAQLDAFSMAMQQTTVYSDEAVKGAQAMLLTFDKIRGTRFDQATQAVADLAARMGGDLQGAAVQVGKALQDPATGLTALRRSGVSFSESQIALIKQMYDTNRVAEGQTIILKELEHQFGGSAAAARNTLGGALTGLKNAFGDLFEGTTQETSALVDFIHSAESAARTLNEYRDSIKATGEAFVIAGAGVAAFKVAMKADALGMAAFATAAASVLALAAAFGVLVVAMQDANEVIRQQQDEADEATKKGKPYLDYLLALGKAHSQAGGAGALVKPPTKEDSEALKKFHQLTDEISQQTEKQNALNAVFGQSALTLQLVGIRQDEAIKNKKIDIALSADQHAQVVALNHEHANALIAAANLAAAYEALGRARALALANLRVDIATEIEANLNKSTLAVSRATEMLTALPKIALPGGRELGDVYIRLAQNVGAIVPAAKFEA